MPIAAFARDGMFVGASDAARSLLGFRNLAEAGLDEARNEALKRGPRRDADRHRPHGAAARRQRRRYRPGRADRADAAHVADAEPRRIRAAARRLPDAEPPASAVTAHAVPDEPPAPTSEAPADALFDAFAEPPSRPTDLSARSRRERAARDAYPAPDADADRR